MKGNVRVIKRLPTRYEQDNRKIIYLDRPLQIALILIFTGLLIG